MIKCEEAIDRINDVLNSTYLFDESIDYQLTSDDFDWLEKTKAELEARIPKKPTPHKIDIEGGVKIGNVIWGKNTTAYRCPCCDELISKVYLYCYKCGQAIDWSE